MKTQHISMIKQLIIATLLLLLFALNIHAQNVSVHIAASATTIAAGQSVTFTSSNVNGGSTPAYQWYKNGSIIANATSNTYSASNLANHDTIQCRMNGSNLPDTGAIFSNKIVMSYQNYFRTVKSGNYTDTLVWEGSADSINWAPALSIPQNNATSIEIRDAIGATAALSVPNLTISAKGEFTDTDTTLTGGISIYGNLVVNGPILVYRMTMAGTVQTISGTNPIYLSMLNIDINSTTTLLSSVHVTRLVQISGLLNTGDSLTLVSNATATAMLANWGKGMTGKVHIERYIPGGSAHRRWRFASMPVQNETFATSWQQDIYITGPGIGGKDCSMPGGMIPNFAGFDQNQTGMHHPTDTALTSTVFTWDEQSNAWRGIPSTSTAIDPTVGYRVFIRGDRNIEGCALLTAMPDSTSAVTLHGFGEVFSRDFTKNLTYTAGQGEGWNLLSNPYPHAILWDQLRTTSPDPTNVDFTISILNPLNGQYAYYNAKAQTGVNGGSNLIASGQSFFVQAFSNTTLSFHDQQNAKLLSLITKAAPSTNAGLFGKTAPSLLKIRLAGPDIDDEAVIVQWSDATYQFDKGMDSKKSFNYAFSTDVHANNDLPTGIASGTTSANKPLVFNFIPFTQQADTLPLFVKMKENTSYTFSFPEISIEDVYQLLLHDKYTNTYTDIRKQNSIAINTQTDAASYSDNRFELLIVKNTSDSTTDTTHVGTNEVMQNAQTKMVVYPVPANEILNVQLNNESTGTAVIAIYDITGKEVFANNFTLGQSNETVALSLNNIAPGAYFVRAVVNGQPVPAQKFIKN